MEIMSTWYNEKQQSQSLFFMYHRKRYAVEANKATICKALQRQNVGKGI